MKAHKARDALKEFMTKGRHDVASKVQHEITYRVVFLTVPP